MPIVDESKQNKGVNNNTRNKQMAIDMEYYNRLNHLRFKSPYLGAKYQQRAIPVRTLNGVQDVFVDNRGTIKQGGHTHSKLYNYSNKNRTHPIKGAYAREVDSWNNNTSPIKALVNSGIGYALAPAAQAVYDYTKGALDISKNPTKASNYLVMLPAIGYAVKAPLKRGVEVAMRMMQILQKTQYIICIKQVLKSMLEYCLIQQLVQGTILMLLKHILDFRKQLKVMI